MSFFGNVDGNEKPRAGVFARLRGWRAGVTEEAGTAPVEPAFPVARNPKRGPGAPAGSLGARLRDADVIDVTDVEAIDAARSAKTARRRFGLAAEDLDTPIVGPRFDAFNDVDEQPRAQPRPREESVAEVAKAPEFDASASVSGHESDTASANEVREQVEPEVTADAPEVEASETEFESSGPEDGEPRERAGIENLPAVAAVPEVEYTPVGLPRLISAQSLAEFKRILCDTTPEATLRISAAARREFVAVDMQAGVAVVIATREFHQTALHATYIRDLERAHITVREEMIATADVIAEIYERGRVRLSKHVPEGSRAIAVFRDIVEAAQSYSANDVHWEYRDYHGEAELRFRVNGDLYTYRHMPKETVLRALSAAYQDLVQRNTNSGNAFQPTAPQSAMIPLALATDTVNLRWQSSPQVGGFDVALRVLDGNFRNYTVRMPETMGLEQSQLAILQAVGHASGGVSLFSGETGSAKSTLLRALSYMLPGRELKKQYAVSLPSEYPMPWLSDQSITRGLDETEEEARRKVATVIRTLMRMDPDDLTIAEILDDVVAGLVAELALTGHPVRTTIHADSIIGIFMRLLGNRLKLAVDEVSSEKFVNVVSNQKLIPMLCGNCKRPAAEVMPEATLELLRSKFGLDTSKMACRDENGCEHCRLKGLFTRDGKVAAGTKGQTLAMELYRPTPDFLDRVAHRDWRGAETVWRSTRTAAFGEADMTGKTIYEHALYKASQGLIDPRFIDLSMRPFDVYRVLPDRDGGMPS